MQRLATEPPVKAHIRYSNIYPTRCNVTPFILSGNCSTCFGWYHHPSSGAQTTVSTASGICHTITATCRYRRRVGTGLSVPWVAYATVVCTPDDGWWYHPSSGVQTTVSTASGICHTITATCRYRGRVGTGLSVLWVAYKLTNNICCR